MRRSITSYLGPGCSGSVAGVLTPSPKTQGASPTGSFFYGYVIRKEYRLTKLLGQNEVNLIYDSSRKQETCRKYDVTQ